MTHDPVHLAQEPGQLRQAALRQLIRDVKAMAKSLRQP
jgi:hypothetical protein